MDDLGAPSSYLALEPGADVYSRDGARLGQVRHVLAVHDADIFDGLVVDASSLPGGLRFVDALEVAGIHERGVVLTLTAAEAEHLPEPSDNPGVIQLTGGADDVDRSELRQKLRRAWETISGKGLDEG